MKKWLILRLFVAVMVILPAMSAQALACGGGGNGSGSDRDVDVEHYELSFDLDAFFDASVLDQLDAIPFQEPGLSDTTLDLWAHMTPEQAREALDELDRRRLQQDQFWNRMLSYQYQAEGYFWRSLEGSANVASWIGWGAGIGVAVVYAAPAILASAPAWAGTAPAFTTAAALSVARVTADGYATSAVTPGTNQAASVAFAGMSMAALEAKLHGVNPLLGFAVTQTWGQVTTVVIRNSAPVPELRGGGAGAGVSSRPAATHTHRLEQASSRPAATHTHRLEQASSRPSTTHTHRLGQASSRPQTSIFGPRTSHTRTGGGGKF